MERNLGIMTGFQDLDRLLYSIQGGDLCIVAARPGLGKTSFSLNIIENVVLKNSNIGILFFSLEMTSEQLLTRLLCTISKLNLHSIREGILDKLKFKILCKNINKLKKINLWVDDSSYLNILDIKSKIKKFHSSNDLGLVIIDYIQLVDNINSRLNREQQISHVSRTLKNIAKEFRIPIIALSQLNRESEKIERDPKLSDLRESGSIEQDADSVIIITNYVKNFNFKNPHLNVRQLFVAKNRNGPTGTATLIFNNSITKFENHFESKKVKRKK
ncbi:hypothetical protein E5P55_00620 [Candidatus Pinguicoccus supinus]|uniref:SF4 helicase domain-containing protein n=1 Tax=Candidatus Pinguicoccus supinus TaxID=2529394 RepID=A0A7T0BRF7_9BACT|nr:hypothetical protein E5P55_00620 [Candidatus Pinguicoccus supinus]